MLLKWEKWLRDTFTWSTGAIKKKNINNTTKKPKKSNKTVIWDGATFPESDILLNIKEGKNDKNVLYERYETLDNMDVEEVADTLHQIDLKLYSKILPTELVEYGKKSPMAACKHILIKNKALRHLTTAKLQNGMKSSFFERICQKLKQKGNFNSLQAISNGIKVYDDTHSEFDNLELQIKQLGKSGENNKLYILPLETIMADIALSNLDPQSEEANMYFYGIIRFFIQLQDITLSIDEYLEHSLLKEMLSTIEEKKPVKYRKIKKGCSKFI